MCIWPRRDTLARTVAATRGELGEHVMSCDVAPLATGRRKGVTRLVVDGQEVEGRTIEPFDGGVRRLEVVI